MITLELSIFDKKAQGPLKLEFYLLPFGPTPNHILKPKGNDLKG